MVPIEQMCQSITRYDARMDGLISSNQISIKTESVSDPIHLCAHTAHDEPPGDPEPETVNSIICRADSTKPYSGDTHISTSDELERGDCSVMISVKEEYIDIKYKHVATTNMKIKPEDTNITHDDQSNNHWNFTGINFDINPDSVKHIVQSMSCSESVMGDRCETKTDEGIDSCPQYLSDGPPHETEGPTGRSAVDTTGSSLLGFGDIDDSDELKHYSCSILMSVKDEFIDIKSTDEEQRNIKHEDGSSAQFRLTGLTLGMTPDGVKHIAKSTPSFTCNRHTSPTGQPKTQMLAYAREKLFSCSQCDTSFNDISSLKKHMMTHIESKSYPCSQCGKSFKCKKYFKKHIKCHNTDKSYICSQCGKSFYYESGLTKHMRTHTNEKPYSCSNCDKRFLRKSNLDTHMLIHSGEKPYSCSQCDRSFSQNVSLKRHMITHTEEKPYSCIQCGRKFSLESSLRSHVMTHTGERPYTCSQCSTAFSRNGELKKHMMTHTGEKPYSCSLCDKAFSRKHHLQIHVRTHTGEKPYSCSQCDKCFITNYALKKHMKTHADKKPYSCCQCGKRFKRKDHLEVHMMIHAGLKPFLCPHCDKGFTQKNSLQAHIKKLHQK